MGTDIDYSTVPHETIYQHLTGGAGSIDMVEAGRGWQGVAATLQDLRGAVEQAIRGIGVAQQGAAADASTHATMALLPWLDSGVASANGIAERISQQVESFAYTQDSMPRPVTVPEVSFSQNPATWMGEHAMEWLPGIQTEHERALVAAQQAQQRARELMTSYQSTSNDNLAVPQQFAAAPAIVADIADPSFGGAGTGGSSSGGAGAAAVGAHAAATAMAHPASVTPAGTVPQPTPATHHAAPAATAPQRAGDHHAGAALAESDQLRPATTAPFAPSPILAAPTSGAGYRSGRASRVSPGGAGMSGGGAFGPRPTPAFSASHTEAGNATHPGAGHAGRPTRGGGTGFASVPLGATGGLERGERTEHRRASYLLEQDANAIVGDLPGVPPPVIGED